MVAQLMRYRGAIFSATDLVSLSASALLSCMPPLRATQAQPVRNAVADHGMHAGITQQCFHNAARGIVGGEGRQGMTPQGAGSELPSNSFLSILF